MGSKYYYLMEDEELLNISIADSSIYFNPLSLSFVFLRGIPELSGGSLVI